MAYIYESDVGRLGGNLQTTVAYLLSLHKAEYEWNLLGIKVVGHVDALPIPDGTYEYGDAYTVGTAAPYDMWIYTRADEFHAEAYWFNIGKFPAPGPQGPKGDGLEQINKWTNGTVSGVTYDTTDGAEVTQTTTIDYTDSTDGSTKHQQFNTTTTLPIVPGKYISMNATSDNKKMEVKVDDAELALDYIKIDKEQYGSIPEAYAGKINWNKYTSSNVPSTIVYRDTAGKSSFNKVLAGTISSTDEKYNTPTSAIYFGLVRTYEAISKTATDTGTLTAGVLTHLKSHPSLNILYNNQTYYRMDPVNAPNGTLNYIHLDSIEDGNGGYKATGKCFSVTISTREWKVVDLNFGGQTTHNLLLVDKNSGNSYYFQLATNQSAAYTTADVRTIMAEVKGKIIPCVFRKGTDSDKKFYSGILQANDAGFSCYYGDQNMDFEMTPAQVTVRDKV